jgi:hypothetical protein
MKKKNRLLIKRNTSQKKNMGAKAMQFVLQHRGKFTGVCVWGGTARKYIKLEGRKVKKKTIHISNMERNCYSGE